MKRLYFFMIALLSLIGMTAKAAETPVSGSIKAGVEYAIAETGTSVDDYFTTSEVIEAGKTIVVFYYNHSTEGIWGTSPIYFGPGGDDPLSRTKTLKDAAGNSVCKLVANTSKVFDKDGHAVIEVYQPKEEGATWTYVICTETEAASLAVPEFGGGNNNGKVDPIAPVSGSLLEKTEYTIPGTGSSFDQYYTGSETLSAGQTIVVFYYSHESGYLMKVPVYFGKGGKNPLSTKKTEVDADGNKVARIIADASTLLDASGKPVVELYQPDNENATWCYVICSEEEAETIAIPEFGTGGGAGPVVDLDGQTEEKAFTLTQTATSITSPKSKTSATEYVVYAKFVAAASGTAKVNMPEGETNGKYLKKPGDATYKTFNFDNSFEVESGQTYYIWYRYKSEVTGEANYTLREAGAGESRGAAILVENDGQHNLLGVPSVEVEGGKNYTNTTTWFKLEKDGALDGKDLMTVQIGGDNTTEVALYLNNETSPVKTYAMGDGSGMLLKNSTVKFDIDVTQNDYYVGITQDDVNGTAKFTFSVAQPGETIAKALTAAAGENTVETAGWYKYTHAGDKKVIKVSGTSTIVNEDGGLVAEGDDVKVGFVIEAETSIFFQASANFTITLADVEKGMTADDPVIITNEDGATFNLSGAATDTQRFMQYSATEDGTFIYATPNASVIEYAVSATVRDITNPESPKTVTIVQEETTEFGDPYFIYKWSAVAGHTYAIEQSLGNNFGKVDFYTMFTPAEAGETINKAIAMDLYEAIDLGRVVATPKFYKFTATEAGDYTLSVQMKGYVKSYDAEGNGSSIGQNYSNGLVYHNETFTLAAGETLVFSCEPSETIEHIAGGVQDQLIPNYYATITKADETGGLDYNQPESISENDEMTLADNNVWMGPIAVPAEETLYVQANLVDESEDAAIFFAVETNSGLQWINKDSEISLSVDGKTQLFTVAPAKEDRNIQILAYGMKHNGTFKYAFDTKSLEPVVPATLTITPDVAYNAEENKLTVSFVVPATYDDSETAVEGLNIALDKIVNATTGEEVQVDNGGSGVYAAGETFTAENTITMAINEGDVLRFEFWKDASLKHITLNVANVTYSAPLDDEAYYMVVTKDGKTTLVKVTEDLKVEWKKGAELKK